MTDSARTSPLSPAACADLLLDSGATVALTGAGISTAAGLPDFRGPEGLYATRRYDPERVFEIHAFRRDPAPFYAFSRDLLDRARALEPTFTHRWLARMEAAGRLQAVVTQNIDSLHQRTGSERVLPVHGNYARARCLACGREFAEDAFAAFLESGLDPRCPCGPAGIVKPEVVFFGEPVRHMEEAEALVREADLLLVLGSSLRVHPVAALPWAAEGAVVVVNRGPVGLPPGAGRHFVDADLDAYFREVDAVLRASAGVAETSR